MPGYCTLNSDSDIDNDKKPMILLYFISRALFDY